MDRDYSDTEKLNKRLEIFESDLPQEEKLNLLNSYELDKNIDLIDIAYELNGVKALEIKDNELMINDNVKVISPNLYQVGNSIKSDPIDFIAIVEEKTRKNAKNLYENIEYNKNNLNTNLFNITKDDIYKILKNNRKYDLKSEDILRDFNIEINDDIYLNRQKEIDEIERIVDFEIDVPEREYDLDLDDQKVIIPKNTREDVEL